MASSELSQQLIVHDKREIAQGVFEFDLRDPQHRPLPPFTPGAHLSIRTPSGVVNKYSLTGLPADRERYLIALKRDPGGAGGSLSMADQAGPGTLLAAAPPVNTFELKTLRPEFLFIAGGIGITPIYGMIQSLVAAGATDFQLVYLSRSPEATAYRRDILSAPWADRALIHHTQGDSDARYDLWPLLEQPGRRQVYCCGPQALMEEVRAMTGHWASGCVNFESFGVDESLFSPNVAFDARLRASGETVHVDADTSLLDALGAHGVRVPHSCESGTCGTCKTPLLSGQVEHRDMVLDEAEQAQYIMVCVSRGLGGTIELDL